MPIYDCNGTVISEVNKVYDNNGTENTQIKEVYDNNGVASSLVYKSEKVLYKNGTYSNELSPNWTRQWFNYSGGGGGAVCTVTNNPTEIYMALAANVGYVAYQVYSNIIDMRGYSKLKFTIRPFPKYRLSIGAGIYQKVDLNYYAPIATFVASDQWTTSNTYYEFDISKVAESSLANARIAIMLSSTPTYGNSWVFIQNITLEN